MTVLSPSPNLCVFASISLLLSILVFVVREICDCRNTAADARAAAAEGEGENMLARSLAHVEMKGH